MKNLREKAAPSPSELLIKLQIETSAKVAFVTVCWLAIFASTLMNPASAQTRERTVSFVMQISEPLCIETLGRIQDGALVVLGDCRHPGSVLLQDHANSRIRFAARQQLCLGFDQEGRGLVLQCTAVEQRYHYDERSGAIRLAVIEGIMPNCLGVRGAPRIGSRVLMAGCTNALNQRFSVEAPLMISPEPAPPLALPPPQPRL